MAKYSDLAGWRNSSAFIDRCTIAVASYAKYIINEATSVADHNRRFTWASNAILNPGGVLGQLGSAIVLDPVFTALADGTPDISSITDAQIDSAVQSTINATLLAY